MLCANAFDTIALIDGFPLHDSLLEHSSPSGNVVLTRQLADIVVSIAEELVVNRHAHWVSLRVIHSHGETSASFLCNDVFDVVWIVVGKRCQYSTKTAVSNGVLVDVSRLGIAIGIESDCLARPFCKTRDTHVGLVRGIGQPGTISICGLVPVLEVLAHGGHGGVAGTRTQIQDTIYVSVFVSIRKLHHRCVVSSLYRLVEISYGTGTLQHQQVRFVGQDGVALNVASFL